jgi:hypothetical protein
MAKSSNTRTTTPMTPVAAVRIQVATARANGGQVASGTFASRVQSVVALQNSGNSGGKK